MTNPLPKPPIPPNVDLARDALVKACEATLLFHGPRLWDGTLQGRWEEITGSNRCDARRLCDFVRAALAKASGDAASCTGGAGKRSRTMTPGSRPTLDARDRSGRA